MNIVLMGYRGCGKTMVGRIMAEKLRRPFFDTDAMIQERAGKTIREIVADGGWAAFRSLERGAVFELAGRKGCVIALGGGAVLDQQNVKELKRNGFFLWLTADAATIEGRLRSDRATNAQRPSLSGMDMVAEIETMLREREPVYRSVADRIINTTGRSADEVANEIMLMTHPHPTPPLEGGGQEGDGVI
ncbi:MAG: shikimate kinase [Syntrophales bacterium]|jgi:shikimate kinase|nr:shikimate kinase [Syntrophales bacterium]MCK9392605.1 shikimate kinase [Syntrophales bacterium]